ncbi:hypothetical protein [uncultured Helicobacter sp.]|uniref:lipase family protein n=1 Tax=uncultured Helicobacter sp. TaxID=175537 RepID=UPI00263A38F2|nr:hypothetical protein [uncultured Helicobacter sp.]
MTNKQQVQRLRDCAELAMAAYGYFHLETSEKNPTFINVKDNKEQEIQKEISLTDILDMTYKDYKVYIPSRLPTLKPDEVGKLNGDFSPLQSKNFFERYDLLEHCPNTNSGFSATLFKDTKADSKDSEYILSFRGTELSTNKTEETAKDLHTDFLLGTNRHTKQYFDMIDFIETKVKPIIYDDITQSYAKMTIVGHSLGGYLAQMFALSYSHLVDKVYTYNAPGIFNDDTEKLFNQLKIVATLFPPIQSLVVGSIIANSIISLFESQVNIQAYEMLQTSSDTGLYCGMIEINETLFQRIESYQSNSKRLLAIKGTDNSAFQLKHTIPYFLRTDQEEISLENSKINGVRKIFYIPSMQEYAQKLYDKIKAYRDTHKGQTFYVYYAYAFVHTSTQAKICESNTIILDYDLHIPFGSLGNQFKSLRQNNAYTPNTLAQEQFFHIISKDLNSECDIIGNLGIKTLGERYEIQIGKIGFINTHSIIPLTQTLYLYSYLLELDSNNEMIESKLNTQDKKEKLQKYIHELNVFMDNIRLSMNILINEIDKENVKKYEKYKQNTKWYQTTPKYEEVDFLPLFISQINEKAYKIESLKQDNNQYFQSNINKEEMIDSILKLQEKSYLIEMFDIDKLKELRNNCKADKKSSITEKLSLATCQPFELVNSQNMALINKNNVNSIFGYLHLGYLLTQEWHEEYINGRYKIMKGLYFNGKTSSSFSQYMIKRDDEKEAINH